MPIYIHLYVQRSTLIPHLCAEKHVKIRERNKSMEIQTITTTTGTGTAENPEAPKTTGQPAPATPTVEDLTKQIEALTAAMNKQKKALDNAAADAAEWKRQYRATLDEAARAKAEQDEANAARDAELATYKRKEAVSNKVTKYLAMGYPEDLARQSAEAYVDGRDDVVLDLQKQFTSILETNIKASLLAQQPAVTPGMTPPGNAEAPEVAAFRKGTQRGY